MVDLNDLYREVIMDHYRNPRNQGTLPTPPAQMSEGHNPLCGDNITVYVQVDGDTIADVKIDGSGCSISQSSASMMSAAILGKTVTEAEATVTEFKTMMAIHEKSITEAQDESPANPGAKLGDLEALRGVVEFPVRIKCATLGWITLEQALAEATS